MLLSLGADVVVDYKRENFAEVLSGYDVVLDSLGGETSRNPSPSSSPADRRSASPARRTRLR
jgi:NADPH:quinone reductase-like Zn-dependent oxidoreductase